MRNSIVWMLAASAAVALAAAGVAGGARAQEMPPAQPAASAVTEDTLRDVEVMRRVLAKEAMSAPALSDVAVRWIGVGGASASEAYVVGGDGATFILRTSDPVAPPKSMVSDGSAAAEPSAWDEAEAEVAGRPQVLRYRVAAERYDAAKVDALRDRIVAQLAKFGHKVRGLGAADHLTVVVVGGARAAYVLTPRPDTATTPGTVTDEQGRQLSRVALSVMDRTGGASGAGGSTVLTIRVSVADCRASAGGSMDLDAFRRRAVISAY